MPKPSAHLPEREVAICNRLRQFRESLKWSMPDFARELGITRDRLASYEYARAPLRFDLAARLCTRFKLNPGWLSLEIPPQLLAIAPMLVSREDVPPRMLFSEAYDRFLKVNVDEAMHLDHLLASGLLTIGVDPQPLLALYDENRGSGENAERIFVHFVRQHVIPATASNQAIFFAELTDLFAKFVRHLKSDDEHARRTAKKKRKG